MLRIISLRYQALARTSEMGCTSSCAALAAAAMVAASSFLPSSASSVAQPHTGVGATAPKATRTCESLPSFSMPPTPMEIAEMSSAGRVPNL